MTKHIKWTRIEASSDGENWTPLDHTNCRCTLVPHAPQWMDALNPGLLSMRWPAWVAQFYANGRRVDGKRARRRTMENAQPEWKQPFQVGNN